MVITHLVVNGCSWTYCQGLADPKTQGWPALVSKELGVPVVNIALPGSGNDAIHRRTYEYVYQNLPTGSNPLFLIFWSQYWRREAWYELDNGTGDYRGIHPGIDLTTSSSDVHERALITHWNDEDFLRKTLLYKLSTINLFRSLDIPFLIADFGGPEESLPDVGIDMKNAINLDKCHLVIHNEESRLINVYPKLPCGHDGVEAQVEISKWWIKYIKLRHPGLNTSVNRSFIAFDEYMIEKDNPHCHWK